MSFFNIFSHACQNEYSATETLSCHAPFKNSSVGGYLALRMKYRLLQGHDKYIPSFATPSFFSAFYPFITELQQYPPSFNSLVVSSSLLSQRLEPSCLLCLECHLPHSPPSKLPLHPSRPPSNTLSSRKISMATPPPGFLQRLMIHNIGQSCLLIQDSLPGVDLQHRA